MEQPHATVRASAPARVDLAGGTLDIWPLNLLVEGALTVNVAISMRATVEVRAADGRFHHVIARDIGKETEVAPHPASTMAGPTSPFGDLPLHEAVLRHVQPRSALHVVTQSAVPAGSGLGGSSALAVTLLAGVQAFEGRPIVAETIAAVARDLEARILEIPTGTQDHLAALHGSVSVIRYAAGGPVREEIPAIGAQLEACGVLAYLGASRASAKANWDMFRRALDGESGTRRGLSVIAGIAAAMEAALRRGDLDECGRLLAAEWKERRGLAPTVTTTATDRALEAARHAGATGGKVCGAGGGGCVFVMGDPDAHARIAGSLVESGCRVLEFRVDTVGLKTESQGA